VQKSCKAETCRRPWEQLHPNGHVQSLADALHPRFDEFYKNQVKVEYEACELGYIVGSEGPQFENVGHRFGDSWE
jgi:N-acetylglucosamine-6-sulfatase